MLTNEGAVILLLSGVMAIYFVIVVMDRWGGREKHLRKSIEAKAG